MSKKITASLTKVEHKASLEPFPIIALVVGRGAERFELMQEQAFGHICFIQRRKEGHYLYIENASGQAFLWLHISPTMPCREEYF